MSDGRRGAGLRRAFVSSLVAGTLVLAAGCRARRAAPGADVVGADAEAGAAPCAPAAPCDPASYCAYAPRLCGKGKRPGVCRARPVRCEPERAPVCGCDGEVYENECQAHAAGVDLDVNGRCRARVADWIACGAHFCDARRSYCEIVLSDVVELPTDYVCTALPPACVPLDGVARDCTCFPAGTRCATFCGTLDNGGVSGFHLTCRR